MKANYIDRVRNMDAERGLYVVGIVMVFIGILIYAVASLFHVDLFHILGDTFGVCPFYRMTGYLCPGCGGTRAFHSFLTGHLINSFRYNAFVWYVMCCYVIFMISQTIRLLTKEKYKGFLFHMRYIYIGVAILVLQCIIKNVVLHIR